MHVKQVLLAVMLLAIGSVACAQTESNPINQNVFPPTPEAAAFTKFTNHPVSYATGVPEIGIPIYSYDQRGLKVNVSLSYHAGGIRVDEVATDVGLSWSLSYGGNVSRIVRGLPDDTKEIGYFYLDSLSSGGRYVSQYMNGVYGHAVCYDTVWINDTWWNLLWSVENIKRTEGGRAYYMKMVECDSIPESFLDASDAILQFHNNVVDSQSDIFSYSIGSQSGKFVYAHGESDTLILTPQSRIKVRRLLNPNYPDYYRSLLGFEIQDTDGTTYHFKDGDITYSFSGSILGNGFTQTSSWNITKIVNADKTDSVTFLYDTVGISYATTGSAIRYTDVQSWVDDTNRSSVSAGTNYVAKVQRIKEIQLPDNTRVYFKYKSIARKDMDTQGGALDSIIVQQGNVRYGYKLWQSYNHGQTAYSPGPTNVSSSLRLYLDSLHQWSSQGALPAYRFTYTGDLPDRISNKVDWWGYYSSQASSTTKIPAEWITPDLQLTGSNRIPYANSAKNGLLTKITYPTKGEVSYEYEGNRAGDDKLIYQTAVTETATVNADSPGQSATFTINRESTTYPVNFRFKLNVWCPGAAESCVFTFKVKSQNGATTYATQTFSHTELHQTKTSTVSGLANGTYQLTWQLSSGCSCSDNFGFLLTWNKLVTNTDQLAGGVRVKKITVYDGIDHNNDLIREFTYTNEDGSSSGTVREKPEFKYTYLWQSGIEAQQEFHVRSSSLNIPLSFSLGAPVVYGRVVEKQTKGSYNNGHTEYLFTDHRHHGGYACPEGGNAGCFPHPTTIPLDYELGLLTRQMTYDSAGLLLQKKETDYNFFTYDVTDSAFISFKLGHKRSTDFTGNLTYFFDYLDFFPFTGRVEKAQERTTSYYSTTDSLVAQSMFFYDPDFYNLKRTRTFTSEGDTLESRLYYPYNYSLGGAIGYMRNNGWTSPVVSQESWKMAGSSEWLLDGSIIEYTQLGTQIKPSRFYKLNTSTPLSAATVTAFNAATLNRAPSYFKEEIAYDYFDAHGNLLQYTQQGVSTSIVWGHQNSYSLAKAINTDKNNIAYTSFENDGNTSWTIGSVLRSTASARTGDQSFNLANGNISKTGLASQTYVVSFWSQSADVRVNGSPATAVGSAIGGWTYYEARLTTTNVTISRNGVGSVFIDELRLYPEQARMITYTYKPGVGVTSVTNENNQSEFYEYDPFNRLLYVRDQNKGIVKSLTYNYKN